MSANAMQCILIARYAARRGLAPDAAAPAWISRRARAFRRWYTRHQRAA